MKWRVAIGVGLGFVVLGAFSLARNVGVVHPEWSYDCGSVLNPSEIEGEPVEAEVEGLCEAGHQIQVGTAAIAFLIGAVLAGVGYYRLRHTPSVGIPEGRRT